jgi:nitrate/TMAO reductase-like tetraheme cytochrome c subunit
MGTTSTQQAADQGGEGRRPAPNSRFATRKGRWIAIFALVALGALIGATGIIASTEINRATSTDAFCTSCHTMATVAEDPHFRTSPHRTNAIGVLASCSDCHIPTNNWFIETYTHLVSGIKDAIAENTGNFNDPSVWNARRIELANITRNVMRRNRGITCRKCHEVSAIPAAKQAHAAQALRQATCVDCHSIHAQLAAMPKQ